MGVKDEIANKPKDPGTDWRDPLYRPFYGAGIYRGGWPYVTIFSATLALADASGAVTAKQASTTTTREAILNLGGLTPIDVDGRRGFISGSWYGNLAFYEARALRHLCPEAIARRRGCLDDASRDRST